MSTAKARVVQVPGAQPAQVEPIAGDQHEQSAAVDAGDAAEQDPEKEALRAELEAMRARLAAAEKEAKAKASQRAEQPKVTAGGSQLTGAGWVVPETFGSAKKA